MDVTLQVRLAMRRLLQVARVAPGGIVVLGCSTSEVRGRYIGTSGDIETANAILEGVMPAVKEAQLFLAVQCCEHLNRALVVEEACAKAYNLDCVCVTPAPKAGGACAAAAMRHFERPAVVESIRAHAGMDIGSTLIGMHLRQVAVPVRFMDATHVGEAPLVMAYTRPRYIGGARACYEEESRQAGAPGMMSDI